MMTHFNKTLTSTAQVKVAPLLLQPHHCVTAGEGPFLFSFEHASLHWIILHAVVQAIHFGLLNNE
jgi:hypothetical protein